MEITNPSITQIPRLKKLWKEAFGDTDEFIDSFFETAFSSDRCRCITIDEKIAAVLYWFDCEFNNKRIAYIYAVATAIEFRGQGLCHKLMNDTHQTLINLGYSGAILVPGSKKLFEFYAKMGYETCSYIDEFSCTGNKPEKEFHIHKINKTEFATLRRQFLPPNAVIQENENLLFLETQAEFYTGDDFLLTSVSDEDTLIGIEFLGNKDVCENIVHSLGFNNGTFRTVGKEKPFAMYFPLEENIIPPQHFLFAFD